ncbi:hypothetical protein WJX82_007867 [Trebouxia sp. C0006]
MQPQNRFAELQKRVVLIDKRLSTLERAITASDRTAALQTRQEVILQRICSFEGLHVEASVSGTEAKLGTELKERGVKSFSFKAVPANYYKEDLEFRRACLEAASIQHLCKSLIYENPKLPVDQESSGTQHLRYYLVIVQYAAKLHGEKVKRFLHKNNGKLGTQYFRPRQAAFETSEKLSGYPSGSVTPVGLKTPLPIILSHEIAKLQPDFFWMGGDPAELLATTSVGGTILKRRHKHGYR